jgi:hypothetical protein
MSGRKSIMDIYLEIGKKRTFAGAVAWPGWARSGRGEEAALQALLESGSCYARVLHAAGIEFEPPSELSDLTVVERLEGTSTTDFGAPDVAPPSDMEPVAENDVQRFQVLLRAYWDALAGAVDAAAGRELRKGPRGGGREMDGVLQHVINAESSYLRSLGWKPEKWREGEPGVQIAQVCQAMMEALEAGGRGELPEKGPRGGKIWPIRYYARRSGWHILDHVWEIEERVI